jgi:hypothetical protein
MVLSQEGVLMKTMFLALALLAVAPVAHAVEVDTAYLNFGSISVHNGMSQTQYVTVSNTSTQTLGPIEVASNCFIPDFTVGAGCSGQTLQSNQACQIFVTFKPSREGMFNCTIRIGAANAQGESDVQVTGTGTYP